MKTKVTSLLTLSCSMFILNPCYAEPGNWLIGASGGYASRYSSISATMAYNNPNNFFSGIAPISFSEDYSDSGITWGLLAGYQARCENFILGGELSIDWEDIADDQSFAFSDNGVLLNNGIGLGWNGTVRYEREYAIILSARMGYVFESLMYFLPPVYIPYVRAGVETSKDTIEATYSGGNPTIYPFGVTSSHQGWPIRFMVGVGTEVPFANTGAAIRFEYNYHTSGQTLETSSIIIDGGIVNPSFYTAMDPIIQSVKVALVWNF